MDLTGKHFYEFGPFRIDPHERVLYRDGRPVSLHLKAFDTLLALVEKNGRIVEKDELMERVWPDTIVEEVNLARQVSNLRKVLGEGSDQDRSYIETVPRRGYRFVAAVTEIPIEIDQREELTIETHSLARIVTEEEDVSAPATLEIRRLREGAETALPPRSNRMATVATVVLAMIVGAIGFGLYSRFGRDQTQLRATAMAGVPFTSYQGSESLPAFSPDGNRIAYVWDGEKEDNFDLYVQLIKAGPPLRLTSNPDPDIAPAWSPDGNHIVFVRLSGNERTIFLIPSMGGPERKLLSFTPAADSWQAVRLSWSPDGKYIAFSAGEASELSASLCLLSVETLEYHRLTPAPQGYFDTNPGYSPDGKILAFIRNYGSSSSEVYLVPATGGEPRRLTSDNLWIESVDWTADGRELVYAQNRSGSYELWRISISGAAAQQLTAVGENIIYATLSRQGDRLAYVQLQLDFNIWRWELTGSADKRLRPDILPTRLIASTRIDTNPQYSPDGKKVAFTSDRTGSREIWVCESDGGNPIRLTGFNGSFAGSPRWSPDGRQIAFDSTTNGPLDIYVVGVDGGLARRFTTEPTEEILPSWSRDGKWIYFGSNRGGEWQVWKAPVEGGAAVQVTKHGGREAFESPDGRFVYYANGAVRGIRRTPSGGGEEVLMIPNASEGRWGLLNEGVYFLVPKLNRNAFVQFFGFATGMAKEVGEIEMDATTRAPKFSVSPDGKWILCARRDKLGRDIILVEGLTGK